MTPFLMNCWYMGGWSHEVTGTPISRRLLGVGTMFYRTGAGAAVALRDRCPHRFAPLSAGKVVGNTIQCPYHGLAFDASGQCVSAPLEEKPPRSVRVQSFPVVERDGIVWFWPGDRDAADPSSIPDFSYLADPAYRHVYGVTQVEAHFELETDNLMDLSHVELLHPAFFGVLGPKSRFKATRTGDQVQADWFSSAAPNTKSMEYGPFPTQGGLIDQWLEMRWNPPGSMFLEVAVTRTGEPREAGYAMPSVHILTPETHGSTLYFWAASVDAANQGPLDEFRERFVQTFDREDKPMIEAVAAAMDGETDLLAMKPLLLRTDAGSVLARRVLKELIAKEREEPIQTAAE